MARIQAGARAAGYEMTKTGKLHMTILDLIDVSKLTPQQVDSLSRICGLFNDLGREINQSLETSRSRMMAFAYLEQSEMWVLNGLAETIEADE